MEGKIAAGGTPAEIKTWSAQLFNNRVDAIVTATFLVLVAIVVIANARVWYQLLSGRRTATLHEDPYVTADAKAV
jgi:carbon starvation protein